MFITLFGICLGAALGFAVAGPAGGAIGAGAGAVIGMLWAGAIAVTSRIPQSDLLVREEHGLLCVPKGQVATATFVRETGSQRWFDVERCSLCDPEDQVGCNKRCLVLMRDLRLPAPPPA